MWLSLQLSADARASSSASAKYGRASSASQTAMPPQAVRARASRAGSSTSRAIARASLACSMLSVAPMKRTDAPAAPIPTAAPTHRPTPHAPHPRAPSRRPTRNPPPPTRHRRSHSASPPPPLILPADRHPRSRIQRLRPNFATHDAQSRHRRSVSRPAQTQGPGVPVNSLPSWKAGDPHAHLASYPWTSPLTRQLHLDIATYPWTGQLSRPVEDCEECPALAGVRKLNLNDPSADRPITHCNFGDRRIQVLPRL